MISKLPNTGTSIFAVMSKMAREYGAINISQGYPDFETDPHLIELVNKAMQDGFNQYAPMPGDPELRRLISERIMSDHKHGYDPDTEITITAGATEAIYCAIAATIHPGDEVILFSPAYDCYEPAVRLFGGKPVALQLRPPGFRPDWEAVEEALSKKTRMIIINSPHNPSGSLLTESDMETLERIAVNNGLFVLSDEVYEHIVFDGNDHCSAARFPGLASRTFITASFGKTFHNTGWKTGYCAAPSAMTTELRKVHQYVVFSVNHPVQKALAAYLKDGAELNELGRFYQQKRDLFLQAIEGSRFKVIPSEGTYFQLLDYSAITQESDTDYSAYLTKELKVATIPTSVFNNSGEDFKQLRVCFAKKDETLMEAAEILCGI